MNIIHCKAATYSAITNFVVRGKRENQNQHYWLVRSLGQFLFGLTFIAHSSAACDATSESASELSGRRAVAIKVGQFVDSHDVLALAFAPGDDTVATVTDTSYGVRMWQWRSLPSVSRMYTSPDLKSPQPLSSRIEYSHDGKLLAVAYAAAPTGNGSDIEIWDAKKSALVTTVRDPGIRVAAPIFEFLADDQSLARIVEHGINADRIVVSSTATSYSLWDLSTSPMLASALAVNPVRPLIAVGGETVGNQVYRRATVLLIDAKSRSVVREIDAFPSDSHVASLVWSPDGDRLTATAAFDNAYPGIKNIKTFSAATGRLLTALSTTDQTIAWANYGANGKYLIVRGSSGLVTIWDAVLGHVRQTISAANGPAAISGDTRLLAIASGCNVGIWELN